MQTVDALNHKTRSDLAHIVYIITACVLIIELLAVITYYHIGRLNSHIPQYMLQYVIAPSAWNFTMCVILSKINGSKRINNNYKMIMTIFCITKICAAIAIVHSRYISTQGVFVAAIIAAALLGNSKLIIYSCVDSLVMLYLSVFLSRAFSPDWIFTSRMESAIITSTILIMTGLMANTIVKTRYRSDIALERYICDLEKATKEAKLDMMTGLYNHAEFYNILRREMCKNINKITVALIDVDHFKEVNDAYGHDNGDKVILKIVEHAKQMNDDKTIYVSRYGGDEFAFIFINTQKDSVINYLNETMTHISTSRFDFDDNKKITISIGMFECSPETYEPEDIFSNADLAMYYSKKHGRNKLSIYNDLSDEEIMRFSNH